MSQKAESPTNPWQNLSAEERSSFLFNLENLPDCSFLVGPPEDKLERLRKFNCHKYILSCVSPVFERMFSGDFAEAKASHNIRLDDANASDFQTLLEFIYYNKFDMGSWSYETLEHLTYLAKKYMIDSFFQYCKRLIIDENASGAYGCNIKCFKYAYLVEDQDLIKITTQRIANGDHRYLGTSSYTEMDIKMFHLFAKALKGNYYVYSIIKKYGDANGFSDEKWNSELTDKSEELTPERALSQQIFNLILMAVDYQRKNLV